MYTTHVLGSDHRAASLAHRRPCDVAATGRQAKHVQARAGRLPQSNRRRQKRGQQFAAAADFPRAEGLSPIKGCPFIRLLFESFFHSFIRSLFESFFHSFIFNTKSDHL